MIQRRILLLLLTALLATPAVSGDAQTPAASGIPAEDELAGIQAAVLRQYVPTGTFVGRATISLDDATPVSSVAGKTMLRSMSVVVREFDTAEHAAMAFERISAGAEASLSGVFTGGTQEITTENLPGVGTQATLVRSEYAGQGSEVWLEYVIVQRDRYVFFVSADGSVFLNMPGSDDVDKSLPTVAIAATISTIGEPSPDEPILMEDGMSTGGLWGFMLPSDNPLLMGLVPVHDSILYPTPSA